MMGQMEVPGLYVGGSLAFQLPTQHEYGVLWAK